MGAFAEHIFGDFIGRNALCSVCFVNARTLFCLLTADHGAERHVSGFGRHFRSTLTQSGRLFFAAESFYLKEFNHLEHKIIGHYFPTMVKGVIILYFLRYLPCAY